MKLLLGLAVFMGLSGCSSLVTRGDLNGCIKKCGSESKIEHCSKLDGKLVCKCK